jgi:xanthine dehydrogenase molybdopterin-binding subunit B
VVTEHDAIAAQAAGEEDRVITDVQSITVGAGSHEANSVGSSWPGSGGKGGTAFKHTLATTGQKHFYMETQSCLVIPPTTTGGKMIVKCATQCIKSIRKNVASATGLAESKIEVTNSASGGAYGGKASLDHWNASATAVAAMVLGKPVMSQLDRNTDMSSLGGRPAVVADFSGEIDATSLAISGVNMKSTVRAGFNKNGAGGLIFQYTSISAYTKIKGAKLSQDVVVTDTPLNSIMRAPGDFQGTFFAEAVVEAAAAEAHADPMAVQTANLDAGNVASWGAVQTQAGYDALAADAKAFNTANRWRKRGVYCVPVKYHLAGDEYLENAIVSVNADGSISLDHSGLECGQGINTKAAQAAIHSLGEASGSAVLPSFANVDTVTPKSTDHFPNCSPTWGSGTSEACVHAVSNACATIAKELKKHYTAGMTWPALTAAAAKAGAKMTGTGTFRLGINGATYYVYAAACSSVELDVLTGEVQVLTTDIVYDCGISLNPVVDIGQVEGSFVQAMGFCLSEEQVWSADDGRLLNNGTWDYKPPSAHDIPIKFNVTLLDGENKQRGNVMGSKASGECSQALGTAPFFALKQAIYAARAEVGNTDYVRLDAPATPDKVQQACMVSFD